jgi:hypothetical protein
MSREPIAVLLLPGSLEDMEQRSELEALLRCPGVVAVEPGPVPSIGRTVRGQSRRLLRRLPGRPAAVVVFGEQEESLGRELVSRVMGCEFISTRDTGELRHRFARHGVALTPS